MADFFTSRVDSYDDHMLNMVEGCKEGYIKIAELVPPGTKSLLDLGCGTGLELDEIFKKLPDVKVFGIDLTQAMLDKLRLKHPGKDLTLICGSYFDVDLGKNKFDCTVSFQTMHHFSQDKKTELYKNICRALKPGGAYIEGDYMVEKQEEEDFYYCENERIRREQRIPDSEFYHYDMPCTISNQITMLKNAGFLSAEMVWRIENTSMILAKKQPDIIKSHFGRQTNKPPET